LLLCCAVLCCVLAVLWLCYPCVFVVQTPLHPSQTPMHPGMTPMHPGMTPMHPGSTPAHPSQDPAPDYYNMRAGSSSRDRQQQQQQQQPPPPAAATPGGGGYNAPTPGLGGYTAAATPGMAETPGGAFAGVCAGMACNGWACLDVGALCVCGPCSHVEHVWLLGLRVGGVYVVTYQLQLCI
jgi:hypothetical protein